MAMPPMFYMPPSMSAGPSTAPHSHLVCGGCTTLLMYPQGASNVRCSRCGHVTGAPPAAGTDTSQIVCNGCRVLLSYPRGANSVQCSICHTVTQASTYGHLVCNGCTTMLMFPVGAASVKCSLCHTVTPSGSSSLPSAGASSSNVHLPSPLPSLNPVSSVKPMSRTQTVVVENPPTIDKEGNEFANIAVGVKADAP